MAKETLLKIVNGQVYAWNDGSQGSGLGEGKWDWIGPVATAIGGATAAWIAGKSQGQQQHQYPQGGAQFGATSQGVFGGIDTTTLLLMGGAVLLFMSMPGGKR